MKKQISGGVILSILSQMITIIVGLAYTPVMIKILGQSEYGLYQLVQSIVNYLNLMNFGFSGAYIRYYSVAKTKNDENEIAKINGMFLGIFFSISVLCLIVGFILFINIRILGEQILESDYVIARTLLVVMVLNLAISFPNSLFIAFMSANERFVFQKVTNIIINILIPILNLPLLLMGGGAIGVVVVSFLLTLVRLIVNIWYCIRKLNIQIRVGYFDKSIFKSLLGYTFFIFLSDLIDQLNTNVDKLLLGRIMGTIAVAIYSVGFDLKLYYTTVSWIFPEMYIPETNKIAIEEKNDKKLSDIFITIGRYNNFIILFVLTSFILVGKPFVELWVGKDYITSYYCGTILMLAGYIPAVQTLGVNIQNAKNMHRIRSLVCLVIACLNVVCSFYFIRIWGVVGTCFGTFLAVFIGNGLFMNFYYSKYLKLDILKFWKEMIQWIIPVIGLCLVAGIVLCFVRVNSWISLIVFVACYCVVYLFLLFAVGLVPSERQKVNSVIKQGMDRESMVLKNEAENKENVKNGFSNRK